MQFPSMTHSSIFPAASDGGAEEFGCHRERVDEYGEQERDRANQEGDLLKVRFHNTARLYSPVTDASM